jgi:hypothetical protein
MIRIPAATRNTTLPGLYITIGDVLAMTSVAGGVSSLSMAWAIGGVVGTGATVSAAGFGTAFLASGLALAGGYEIGGALYDLVLNNERLLGNYTIESLTWHYVARPWVKGSFNRGR